MMTTEEKVKALLNSCVKWEMYYDDLLNKEDIKDNEAERLRIVSVKGVYRDMIRQLGKILEGAENND